MPGGVHVSMYLDSLSIADKAASSHPLYSSYTKSHFLPYSESNFSVTKNKTGPGNEISHWALYHPHHLTHSLA